MPLVIISKHIQINMSLIYYVKMVYYFFKLLSEG